MLTPLLILGLLASVALLGYWSAVAFHVLRTARSLPTARDGLTLPHADPAALAREAPSVCVIVPAHNEEANIPVVAASLLNQDYPRLHMVFALDRCSDNTEPALRRLVSDDPRVTILPIEHCPEGWAGKVNALWTAYSTVPACRTADYLLFVDADTRLDPACIRATVAIARSRRIDMLTLLSTLTANTWFERSVQPAASFELVRQFPLHRASRAGSRRAFANGQYILFARPAYERIDGHRSVRAQIFEDVKIAQQAAHAGLSALVVLADRMLYCRMYDSYDEFRRGWRRIFSEAANRKPARLRQSARRIRLVSVLLPALTLLTLLAAASAVLEHPSHDPALPLATLMTAAAALSAYVGSLVAMHRLGSTPARFALRYPYGAWVVASILRDAADDLVSRRPVFWGGREYASESR